MKPLVPLTAALILAACGEPAAPDPAGDGRAGGGPPAGEAPDPEAHESPQGDGVRMPGDRTLRSREEVEERLGVPLPPGRIYRTMEAGYTFAVWMESEDRLEDIVTWFRQNVGSRVPEMFEPLEGGDRWSRRDLARKTYRIARYHYQDRPYRLQVDIEDSLEKAHRIVHVDLVRNQEAGLPPKQGR